MPFPEFLRSSYSLTTAYTSEGRGRFLADRKTQKATLRELQELAETESRGTTS
jgi:hypothetical protein